QRHCRTTNCLSLSERPKLGSPARALKLSPYRRNRTSPIHGRMSAFRGRAYVTRARAVSANDPERTCVAQPKAVRLVVIAGPANSTAVLMDFATEAASEARFLVERLFSGRAKPCARAPFP